MCENSKATNLQLQHESCALGRHLTDALRQALPQLAEDQAAFRSLQYLLLPWQNRSLGKHTLLRPPRCWILQKCHGLI